MRPAGGRVKSQVKIKGGTVAIYSCRVRPIQRSKGQSSVAGAAYRAGEKLIDARTGRVHNYTRRAGVVSVDTLSPVGSIPRPVLWNAAEAAEKRKDGTPAREVLLALPSELDAGQRRALALAFANDLVRRYGVAVDVAIHAPDAEGDKRNYHAHLLMTTRVVSKGPDGRPVLGAKSDYELSDTDRKKRNDLKLGPALPFRRDDILAMRERWGQACNRALEMAGSDARVDHRSYVDRKSLQQPTVHLGQTATALERQGIQTDRGDINRAVREQNREILDTIVKIKDWKKEKAAFQKAKAIERVLQGVSPEPGKLGQRLQILTRDAKPVTPKERQEVRANARQAWVELHAPDHLTNTIDDANRAGGLPAYSAEIEKEYARANRPILRWLPSRKKERERLEPIRSDLKEIREEQARYVDQQEREYLRRRKEAAEILREASPHLDEIKAVQQERVVAEVERVRAVEAERVAREEAARVAREAARQQQSQGPAADDADDASAATRPS